MQYVVYPTQSVVLYELFLSRSYTVQLWIVVLLAFRDQVVWNSLTTQTHC